MSSLRSLLLGTAGLVAVGLFVGAGFFFHGTGAEFFMPHAHCYLFNTKLMVLHGGSDLFIGLAYVSISATLVYLVLRSRRELPFHWIMVAFAVFIIACGATHFMEVWTLRSPQPRYWLSGWVKLLTAFASVVTALVLPPLIPKIRSLLEAGKLAGERKAKLEKAYAELDGLYRKVTLLDELKTNFFANVSHELRTPLSLIFAPVERLLRREDLDAESRMDLLMVRRNALMLHKHVNDLLDVSRLEAGKMETQYSRIDLVTLVRFLSGAFESLIAERKVVMEIEAPQELIAEVDGDKMQRVVLNLLSNAMKFAPDEGHITTSLSAEGGDAVLVIDDNGPGIPVELREAVFERFHRGDQMTQRRFGGVGLGLSIVREFVQMHRGTVVAGESPLGGARFTVRLPLRAPAGVPVGDSVWISTDPTLRRTTARGGEAEEESRWAQSLQQVTPEESSTAGPDKPLVLVVEDNRDMNNLIRRILGNDVRTIAAHNGRAALELAKARRPDLILTDMMMPEMSGDELVAAVRQEASLADIPIILLTAKADERQKLSMLTDGVQDYVVKPFSIDELRARVHNQVVAKVTRDTLRKELDSQSQDLAGLARDLSQHSRDLEAAKNAAEAANRAKDQFLAVLSHELRTPLTPALAAATSLEQSKDVTPQELAESLALIRRNIELEARLVDDLLDLTRISKGKLEIHRATVDIHATISHAAEMCATEAHEKGCEMKLSLEATEYHVTGDGARLAQVFWNLMLNAVKFTPTHGCIGLHTSNPAPGCVRIDVSDTGIGIEPVMLSRIFEPFQQGEASTTRRFGGLGLGLSVAKGLVDAHGGTISVSSDGKDLGTTFSIELPTVAAPAVPLKAIETKASRPPRALRILLVEDHADTRAAMERLLKRWGHTVTSAASVEQALEAAAASRPELVLSDVGLPDGTGMDLLIKLRESGELVAIAMSGYGMEGDLEQTRAAGFVEHLVKPVAAERLKEAINRLAPDLPA